MHCKKKLILLFVALIYFSLYKECLASESTNTIDRNTYLTDLNNINLTERSIQHKNEIKNLIKTKKPKAIYVEQWLLLSKENKDLLKDLAKITKKHDTKLYLVIGKNTWFGSRGESNAKAALNAYGDYIDGLVLRVEPNKANVWKDDRDIQAQILSQLLDAYHAIHTEVKKRNKIFVAEFPFWFSDFKGPLKTFPEDACIYTDRIIFLIDNLYFLNNLDIDWNNVTCPYNIDITKRATKLTEDSLDETYQKIKSKLIFYANFNGFITDSDSKIDNKLTETEQKY